MHPMFQVTLYTGQQLVLEAMQRWLRRPCTEVEQHRQRRTKLKDLLLLLIKTAATGVLAAILDAAIEYRRRQLLAAAAAEPGGADAPAGSRFPGLGALSRAGIAAWKHRLLLCIDEMERRAETYGIEATHRFAPAQPEGEAAGSKGKATRSAAMSRVASSAELSSEERQQMLTRTVEQLRDLVKQGDAESDSRLDEEVGSLIDVLLLGPPPPLPPSTPTSPALDPGAPAIASAASSSTNGAASPALPQEVAGDSSSSGGAVAPASPHAAGCGGAATSCDSATCHICMDNPVKVAVLGCDHEMCFLCARRLCAGQDHLLPQCPFCRQTIEGFRSFVPSRAP